MKQFSLSLLAVLGVVVSTQALSQIGQRAAPQPMRPVAAQAIATPTPTPAQFNRMTPQLNHMQAAPQMQTAPAFQGTAPQPMVAPGLGNDGTNSSAGLAKAGAGPAPQPKQPDPMQVGAPEAH